MKYEARTFIIPQDLVGISQISVDEHLKLYQGYVKHANLITEHISELSSDNEKYGYEIAELHRRFSFEYNGIINHEFYFEQIEGGPRPVSNDSKFTAMISDQFGSYDQWLAQFKMLAKTRGVGWAIIYYDHDREHLINTWVDEQHIGHLGSCTFIFGIDMWEHSFVYDYQPSGKGKYIDDYFANVNWSIAEQRLQRLLI